MIVDVRPFRTSDMADSGEKFPSVVFYVFPIRLSVPSKYNAHTTPYNHMGNKETSSASFDCEPDIKTKGNLDVAYP